MSKPFVIYALCIICLLRAPVQYQLSINTLFRNICAPNKKKYPLLKPTDGGADAQYESDVATPHVRSSILPPPQPTDGDVVYEQVH